MGSVAGVKVASLRRDGIVCMPDRCIVLCSRPIGDVSSQGASTRQVYCLCSRQIGDVSSQGPSARDRSQTGFGCEKAKSARHRNTA